MAVGSARCRRSRFIARRRRRLVASEHRQRTDTHGKHGQACQRPLDAAATGGGLRHGGFGICSVRRDQARERLGEHAEIRFPAGMGQLDRIAECEIGQIGRQLVGRWHACTLHQHRDHRNAALQRRGDLEPDEILGVVDPPHAIAVAGRQPLAPDQCEQDVALGNLGVDHLPEVDAGLDRDDVHEHRVVAEARPQPLEQTPGMPLGVLAPVTDENRTHRPPSARACSESSP